MFGTSAPDPFVLDDTIAISQGGGDFPYRQTAGLTVRNQAFNPALRNLVLIAAGQSNVTTVNPTLFTPTNSSVIDNFNIYDGASYSIGGPLLGTQQIGTNQGCVAARLADLFVTNNIFDRVIIVPIAILGTTAANWATGTLSDRIGVAMRRLKSRGYIVGSTGLTFAITWWLGETDNSNATSQASYAASMATVLSNAQAQGFSGFNSRFFVNTETWISGTTSATIQAAQAALPNGTTFFAGGNIDTLNGTSRYDNTHLTDAGAASAATLVYNAIHASGAPF